MGQQDSKQAPVQRYVNAFEDVSYESIEGYLRASGAPVGVLDTWPENKVLVRTDWNKDRVAVVALGGTGHGLADVEYVGEGMLTAMAAGDVWKEPTIAEIFEAIATVTGPAGCVVVLKNAVGDFLSTNIARHELKQHFGTEVRLVVVSDDVVSSVNAGDRATNTKTISKEAWQDARGVAGRGIAGVVLVMKVAGAAAAKGLSIEEVYQEAMSCAAETVSIGVAHSQGTAYIEAWTTKEPTSAAPVQSEGMEFGVGVHGEPGWMKAPGAASAAKDIVDLMLGRLLPKLPLTGPVCVMLNNLGAVPHMEMAILSKQVMDSAIGPRVELFLGPAPFFSALNTNGFSLSVVPLTGRRKEFITAATGCRGWVAPTQPATKMVTQPAVRLSSACSENLRPSGHPEVRRLLNEVCDALMQAEFEIGGLSAKTGTGKLGHNLARFAQDLRPRIDELPLAHPRLLFLALAQICAHYGGVLFTCAKVLLETASDAMYRPEEQLESDDSSWDLATVVEALLMGTNKVRDEVGVGLNQRTFLDSLVPACETKTEPEGEDRIDRPYCEWWRIAAASNARRGARSTAHMLHASDWAAYTPLAQRGGIPDGGAVAVATIFTALATPPEMLFRAILAEQATFDIQQGMCSRTPSSHLMAAATGSPEDEPWAIIDSLYEMEGKHLGSGFGRVRAGTGLEGEQKGKKVAISERRLENITELGMRGLRDSMVMNSRQMLNWLFLPKANVVQVLQVLVAPTADYIVMDLVPGMSLMDFIKVKRPTPRSTWQLLFDILSAVRQLHRARLIHRNLKPEHFRFSQAPAEGPLQLVDVSGMVIHLSESYEAEFGQIKRNSCGTLAYMSPEALWGCGRQAADMWSIGVMTHLMLVGELPFIVTTATEAEKAHSQPLTKLQAEPLPREARDFVNNLLQRNARKRMSAKEGLEYLLEYDWSNGDGFTSSEVLFDRQWSQNACEVYRQCLVSQMSAVDWGHSPRVYNRPERMGVRSSSLSTSMMPHPEEGLAGSKTLYLIRHGEALHNIEEKKSLRIAAKKAIEEHHLEPGSKGFREYVEQARSKVLANPQFFDAPLSQNGQQEAFRAKSHLEALHNRGLPAPTLVLTSPLLRTLQTAAALFPFHSNIHAREDLRERRTGHPCDNYSCKHVELDSRPSFQTMDFKDVLNDADKEVIEEASPDIEDKAALRERTGRFLNKIPMMQVTDESREERSHSALCIVSHKGFLRELERGPFGHPDAAEFSNCEIRVYEVSWDASGKVEAPAKCLYSDASLCTLQLTHFPSSWTDADKVPDLPGKVGALLVEFGHLRQDPSVKDTDKGLVVLAVFEQEDAAAFAAKRLDGLDMRPEEERAARPLPYLADRFSARLLFDVEQEQRWLE
mmetsp:Transcript_16253/g.37464  ORF Transcript_16253/g.37464 Transcript_16253/m.37464 type:complete len:1372 (+) Transcript_16253:131-4246(+)